MEGRGECCIARYGGGRGDSSVSTVDRIMLRFRPIAPKPMVTPAAAHVGLEVETGRGGRRRSCAGGNGKRVRRGRTKRDMRSVAREDDEGERSKKRERDRPDMVTLPLMPETPERMEAIPEAETRPSDLVMSYVPLPWYGCRRQPQQQRQNLPTPVPLRPAGSLVIVECVTDACVADKATLSQSGEEEEARAKLEADSWPAFTSDTYGRVTWTNPAYRKMVGGGGDEEAEGSCGPCGCGGGVRVTLVMRDKIPSSDEAAAFGCRVRVKYASRRERGTLAAQCDVYRLVGGGFCWRLDIDTALSLRL